MSQAKREGFTLVEMAIILVIIGLIAGMILPAIIKSIKREQITNARRQVRMARDEIIGYVQVNKKLPSDLSQIAHGEEIFGNGYDGKGYLFYRQAANIKGKDICEYSISNTTLSFVTARNNTINDIAFVVASVGPNFNLQLKNDNNTVTTYPYGKKNIDEYPGDFDREEPYDDIVEFVTLDYLKKAIGCFNNPPSNGTSPLGADISFQENWDDFLTSTQVEPSQKGWHNSGGHHGPPNRINTIELNNSEKYLLLGNNVKNSYGCFWYRGDSGNCNNGLCEFGSGIRVFFKFKLTPDSSSDGLNLGCGFTFALISAQNNPDIDNTCGAEADYLGYAGHVQMLQGNQHGQGRNIENPIEPPKLATEIDVYNTAYNNDPYNNHIAFMYWGEDSNNDDDLVHGNGDNCYCEDNILPQKCCKQGSTYTWLEDGNWHTFRLDIKRDPATGELQQKAWVDCAEDTCKDLSGWFDGSSGVIIEDNSTPIFNGDNLNTIYFGWTVGTGNNPQTITIENFGINFL